MIITYHGAGMVKVAHGEWVAVFDPIGRSAEFKSSRFGADLALVSFNDPLYNGVAEVTFGNRRPFVVDGPGEYERAGTFIRGFAAAGPEGKINTVYDLMLDGKRLVHLGALTRADLPDSIKQELMSMDILFAPVGEPRLAAPLAYQLALALNPCVIIPVHHTRETLRQFLKEAGGEEIKPA